MRLTIGVRLFISAISFIIPIVVLGYFVVSTIQDTIEFSANEKRGNTVSRPLMNILHDLSRHRVLVTQRTLLLDASKSELDALGADIEKNLTLLEAELAPVAFALKMTDAQLAEQKKEHLKASVLKNQWSTLKGIAGKELNEQSRSLSKELQTAYADAIGTARAMISHVADKSNLILDPDLDSYYMMETSIVFSPDIIDWIQSKQALLITQLASGSATAAEIEETVTVIKYYLNEYFGKRIEGDIDTVFAEDANFYGELPSLQNIKAPFESYKKSRTDLVAAVAAIQPGQPTNLAAINSAFKRYSDDAYALWDMAQQNMEGFVVTRMEDMNDHMMKLAIIGALAAIMAAVIFAFVLRSVSAPIRHIEEAMKELAGGNLETDIPYVEKQDEIGDMARALNSFKDTSIKAEQMRIEQIKENNTKLRRNQRVEELIKLFEAKSSSALSMVSNAAGGMSKSAETMVKSADNTASKTIGAASAMEQTSHNVKAVAAAAEELSSAINEISGQVQKSAEMSSTAVNKTQSADSIAKELAESAKKIGDVIKIISDIASQINLLALNATIESARAGEAGKGFAVVASEVKNLASETTKATEEIATQISGMQRVSGDVVDALNDIRESITQMSGISVMIASAVEEQGAATQEIARNIQTASDGVEKVSHIIEQLQNDSKNTDASAKQVSSAAQLFGQQSDQLKTEVEGFLGGIKSA